MDMMLGCRVAAACDEGMLGCRVAAACDEGPLGVLLWQ